MRHLNKRISLAISTVLLTACFPPPFLMFPSSEDAVFLPIIIPIPLPRKQKEEPTDDRECYHSKCDEELEERVREYRRRLYKEKNREKQEGWF